MVLWAAPAIALAIMLLPVAAGVVGTLLPAFGYLPALGAQTLSAAPWAELAAAPGIARSVVLTATTGMAATLISVALTFLFCAGWQGTRTFAAMRRLLSPLLSLPHAAAAVALAFLIAPSGWILRGLSPWATGFAHPPDWLIVHDDAGLSLIAGLVLKEVPFLFLMTLAALNQIDAAGRLAVARTLGYGRMAGWFAAVLPGLYPQLRLPIYAVLAYSLSAVDMALILGPTNPGTLAVRILDWAHDPDLAQRFRASAAAVLQMLVVGGAIIAWRAGEAALTALGRRLAESGRRLPGDGGARLLALLPGGTIVALALAGSVALALWSFARIWRFPDALPTAWTTANWTGTAPRLAELATASAALAAVAAAVALVLAVACLQHEGRRGLVPRRSRYLLYLPLLVPQVSFLFGTQSLLVELNLDGGFGAVLWSHLVFVIPYVFLALADPYRSYDRRYEQVAGCLGATPAAVFWRIKLPMLLRPVLVAGAVGFAVSVGLYLPTVFAGAGRFATVTTETVALAGGGDRRTIGTVALMQAMLPFVAYAVAGLVPALLFRRRRGMAAG